MSPTRRVEGPVIVGLDETERSRDAIPLARRLARELSVEMVPVYVHTMERLDALAGGPPDEVMRLAALDAEAQYERVRSLAEESGVTDVRLVNAPAAAQGLQEEALDTGAAMVVIGSSRRSGLGRVMPGGTADRLLSGCPVAVAVAPEGHADRKVDHGVIGAGFDGSSEAREAVRWAADLAGRSGAGLRLLTVHAPLAFGSTVAGGAYGAQTANQVLARDLLAESERLVESLAAEVRAEVGSFKDGDPGKVLVEQSEQVDLLVLGSRAYGPIKSVLLGSVSSAVLRGASCPVLVVPRGIDTPAGNPGQGSGTSAEPSRTPGRA
jgi:nucleotide-binding universal stress UspA family protein